MLTRALFIGALVALANASDGLALADGDMGDMPADLVETIQDMKADSDGDNVLMGMVSEMGVWEYKFNREDPHGNGYQWRHYYDDKTGEPVDARVPNGWSWGRFQYGGENNDCPQFDDNGNELNLCYEEGSEDPRCCIRGTDKAAEYCLQWGWCLTISFMEENPKQLVYGTGTYDPSCAEEECPHWEDTDKFYRFMILGSEDAQFTDESSMDFYKAINDPVYVLMALGEGVNKAGGGVEIGDSSFTKNSDDYAKFWNTATPPQKCDDGSLRDCDGKCFNDCKVYGLPGSENGGYEGCYALAGDYVCDRGQRIMANGEFGPNLDCPLWDYDANDGGSDCQCEWDDDKNPTGRYMTCSGYCLSDADCASDYWGKSGCVDWLRDDICDYGQRISEVGITMHFECERWGWDNWACDQQDAECSDDFEEEGSCPDPEASGERDIDQDAGTGFEGNTIPAFEVPGETPAPTKAPHYVSNFGGSAVLNQDISVLKAEVESLKNQVASQPEFLYPDAPDTRVAAVFGEGSRVWCNYYHSGYTYPATVVSIGGSGVQVMYDDGDIQNDVHKDEVFALDTIENGAAVWRLKDDHTDWDYGWIKAVNMQASGDIKYTFEDADGFQRESWHDFDRIRPDWPFQVGDRVWSEKGGNLKWVKGTITGKTEAGPTFLYEVTFDSGDTWPNAPSSYLYFIHSQRVLSTGLDDEGVCDAIMQC